MSTYGLGSPHVPEGNERSEREDTAFERLTHKIEVCEEKIENAEHGLLDLEDRLFGPSPEKDKAESLSGPNPPGALRALENKIDRLNSKTNDLHMVIERLSKLA